MASIRRFDHVCLTVADLDATVAFFTALGFETEGRAEIQGEFIDTVLGLPKAHTEMAMLRLPDGGTALEITRFLNPKTTTGDAELPANAVGLRNLGFEVDALQPILDRLTREGFTLVGSVGRYQDEWLMAHVRGPEGIIVSLAQRLG